MEDDPSEEATMLRKIAYAITDLDASPARDQNGGSVGCLTEAVIASSLALNRIADAIQNLADAVRDHG